MFLKYLTIYIFIKLNLNFQYEFGLKEKIQNVASKTKTFTTPQPFTKRNPTNRPKTQKIQDPEWAKNFSSRDEPRGQIQKEKLPAGP